MALNVFGLFHCGTLT